MTVPSGSHCRSGVTTSRPSCTTPSVGAARAWSPGKVNRSAGVGRHRAGRPGHLDDRVEPVRLGRLHLVGHATLERSPARHPAWPGGRASRAARGRGARRQQDRRREARRPSARPCAPAGTRRPRPRPARRDRRQAGREAWTRRRHGVEWPGHAPARWPGRPPGEAAPPRRPPPASAWATSALVGRAAGSLARQASQIRMTSAGTPVSAGSGAGSTLRCADRTWVTVSASQGIRPASAR